MLSIMDTIRNTATGDIVTLPTMILDIEASGFGKTSYPIEIAVVDADGGLVYESLIKPLPEWTHWSEDAEKTHSISRDHLSAEGRDAVEVARDLNTLLRGQTIYCDAWYHDYMWLQRLFNAVGTYPAFKLESVFRLITDSEAELWGQRKHQAAASLGVTRHRAANDAAMIREALLSFA
jgi:hypothetical protein